MSESERFPRRHPLCTCPEATFDAAPGRSQCKGGTIAHPVLTGDDIRELIERHQHDGIR